jgi:hypothetical protein
MPGTQNNLPRNEGCFCKKTTNIHRFVEFCKSLVSEHIVVTDFITPRTFESFTSMPEGAVYSFDQSKGSKRPYFKTPIEGLYLASSSTFPGGGVEAVVVSGFRCVRDIESHKKIQLSEDKEVVLPPPVFSSGVSIEQAIKKRCSIRL